MKIIELIAKKSHNLKENKIPTIAFFGDSVTQGCFEFYETEEGTIETIFDKEYTYHKKMEEILSLLFPNVPLNIINAGISGDSAEGGLQRLHRDVLAHNPDLVIVCYGLNDVNNGEEGIQQYGCDLKEIFNQIIMSGSELIFMTPNMMNKYVSRKIEKDIFINIAKKTEEIQNSGLLEKYLEEGKHVALECGAKICDVYTKWKTLDKYGVNTTELLSNYINHPSRKMNSLFSISLLEVMFS